MTKINNGIKYFCTAVVAIIIITFSVFSVGAYTLSDEITLKCSYDNISISGMKWNVIEVAYEKDGKYILTDDFSNSGISIDDLSSSSLYDMANTLQSYAKNNNLKPLKTNTTDAYGDVSFNVKENGLYLFYSNSYEYKHYKYTAVPILAVRKNSVSAQVYEPKFEAKKNDTANGNGSGENSGNGNDSDTGHDDDDDSDNSYPDTTSDSNGNTPLPQTGLLWWPVPILSIVGLILIFTGARLNSKKGKNDKE